MTPLLPKGPRVPRILYLLLASLPLLAQTPDAAFFKGDPKAIIQAAAEKARSLRPNDRDTLSVVAQGYLATGERAKAESLFLSMERRSSSIKTYGLIAKAWLQAGIKDPVPALVEKAKATGSRDGDDLTEFAVILMSGGMPKEAGDIMGLAYTADPKNHDGCLDFARACLRAGRPQDALPWLQRALQAKPQDADIWRDVAMALADHGLEH